MSLARRAGQPAGATVPGAGIGQFTGNLDPQDPTLAANRELLDSMTGDPGVRLAGGRGGRKFRAGGLTPQRFAEPQGGANSTEAIEALPIKAGTRRRALGQTPQLRPGGSS